MTFCHHLLVFFFIYSTQQSSDVMTQVCKEQMELHVPFLLKIL